MNFIIANENAIYYECSFSCDNAIYIRLGRDAWFISDARYEIEARERVVGAEVLITSDLYAKAVEILSSSGVSKVVLDPGEWSLRAYERLKESGVDFRFENDFSHKRRIVKSEEEIARLDKAARLGAKAFDTFAKYIRRKGMGKSERELSFVAESLLGKKGKYPLSFDPIVALDENAAKPHATASKKRVKKGSLLLLDAGLKYERYCSDRTRTAFVGRNFSFDYEQKFSSKRVQRAYDAVLKAHDRAIARAESGMKAARIDALAREVIEKAGFGRYFVHSTGHGVGLDIHEMPYISAKSDISVEDGMVFTIEPGIYIPGEFGIRVEDTVVMRRGRAEILGI